MKTGKFICMYVTILNVNLAEKMIRNFFKAKRKLVSNEGFGRLMLNWNFLHEFWEVCISDIIKKNLYKIIPFTEFVIL